jgi:hypothetical protein
VPRGHHGFLGHRRLPVRPQDHRPEGTAATRRGPPDIVALAEGALTAADIGSPQVVDHTKQRQQRQQPAADGLTAPRQRLSRVLGPLAAGHIVLVDRLQIGGEIGARKQPLRCA